MPSGHIASFYMTQCGRMDPPRQPARRNLAPRPRGLPSGHIASSYMTQCGLKDPRGPQPASRGVWPCRREAPHGLQGREQRAAARREIWVGRSGRSSASDTNLRQGTSLARPGPRTFLVAVNRGASRGVGRTHETHRDLMWPDLTVSTRRPTVYVWIATLLQRDSGTTHVPYRR